MQRWFGRKTTTEPSPLTKETQKIEEPKVDNKMVEMEDSEETTTTKHDQNSENTERNEQSHESAEQNGQEEQPQVRLRNGRSKSCGV